MLRRSSSGYSKLEKNTSDPLSAQYEDPSDQTDGAQLFIKSIRQFSPSAAPELQMETIFHIWLSVNTLAEDPDFTHIAKQHQLGFMTAATTLRDYINKTPMQGRLLFRYLMCASICYLAALRFDRALLREESNGNHTLDHLHNVIKTLSTPYTRRDVTDNPAIRAELGRIDHQAARHAISFIEFLHTLSPYIEDMKTRLIHVKASLPAIIPAKKARFFSPDIEDWQSDLDAALKDISMETPNNKIITAYEISLNVLIDAAPKKHKEEFNAFKSMLSELTLTGTQPQHTAANRPSV